MDSSAVPVGTAREPVRLVVWDLDETFWDGTLSEGGIRYRYDKHRVVVELARRGIPSSVCSKNDFAGVRETLEAHDIWGYFVVPSVDWTSPRGPHYDRELYHLIYQTIIESATAN